jgi:hypothetical protein
MVAARRGASGPDAFSARAQMPSIDPLRRRCCVARIVGIVCPFHHDRSADCGKTAQAMLLMGRSQGGKIYFGINKKAENGINGRYFRS